MQFAHISDTHLGVRQFDCDQREQDVYDVFLEAIDIIVKDKFDFVLHSGDLFEYSKPSIRAMVVAKEGFKKLNDKGIPVYIIPGNHEMPKRKDNLCPIEMYRDLVNILYGDNHFVFEDTFIGGVPYCSKVFSDQLPDQMASMRIDAEGYSNKILMLHQGISEDIFGIEGSYELEEKDIPYGFDYYALGHLHKRKVRMRNDGCLAYAGSPEYMSVSEYEACGDDKKGFLLVDTDGDELSTQNVNLDTRGLINKTIEVNTLQDIYLPLKNVLELAVNEPLIWIKLKYRNCDPSILRGRVQEILKDKAVYTKIELEDISICYTPGPGGEVANASEIIRDLLKDKYDEADIDFAVQLVDILKDGDEKGAIDVSLDYYERR